MKRNVISMGLALFLFDQHANAQSSFTNDELVKSKIGDPAFVYKVTACAKMDYVVARGLPDMVKAGQKSIMFTNTGIKAYNIAYNNYFNLTRSDLNEILEDPVIDRFITSYLFVNDNADQKTRMCKDAMKSVINSYEQSQKSVPVATQNSPASTDDIHQACLNARDYEGCVKVKSNNGVDTKMASLKTFDKCKGDICLVQSGGTDVYGLPKPKGWLYTQANDGRLFYFSKPYRIPHKDQSNRYVGIKRITRYYQNPSAGTSGKFIGNDYASTNCSGYGSSISCTTIGVSPTYIPGRSATPGGISTNSFYTVYDCNDHTSASYKDGKVWGGWDKYQQGNFFETVLKKECAKGKAHIMQLDPLYLKM